MKRAIASVLLLAMTATAVAEPHKVVVLQTEGRADPATRLKIDAAITKLAAIGGTLVSSGDITFADAAAGAGCKPDAAACRDEVLGMLAVDEVVYATTTLKPGGTEIEVHRVTRGGVTRDAKMMLAAGQSADSLDGIAPLFIDAKPTEPVVNPGPGEPPPGEPPPPAVLPPATEPRPSAVATQSPLFPEETDRGPAPPRSRLQLAGMIGGGVSMTIGFLLWGEAGSVQEQVDIHPTATAAQLDELKVLEKRGDSLAAWGNLLFLSGMALGAVSTYFYIKGRKQTASQSARIAPAVFDHGAGITLIIGGSP